MFLFLQTVNFHLRFLCESDLRISFLQEAIEKLIEINTFRVRKTTLFSFHIFDQIEICQGTVAVVNLCMKGHL